MKLHNILKTEATGAFLLTVWAASRQRLCSCRRGTESSQECKQTLTIYLLIWHSDMTMVNLCDAIVANDCTNLWSTKHETSTSATASWVRHSCWGREHTGRSEKHRDAELDVSGCYWSPVTGWWTAMLSCYRQPLQAQSSPTQTWNVPMPHLAGSANWAWCGSYSTCTWTYTRNNELYHRS